VEVPRNIASEWQKTDPVTGFFMGTSRASAGALPVSPPASMTHALPFPIPADYQAMMEPEFVITDIWGDPVPDLTEFSSNDPKYPTKAPIYPIALVSKRRAACSGVALQGSQGEAT